MSKTTQEWITFENLCSDTEGREAVAEVVRLRRELEELRDTYRTCPYPYGEVARDLTRILDGSNDD